ncbi:MAG: MlaE family lipid ABC transporter permease subunit [Bacteroidetes bacterium]|jgi:phospholipid/cholesterol/gamma-HCH transport system permease protein|nr:MlaE family lipid ABC transporter permease subunit [Bacteroidota bacterium]
MNRVPEFYKGIENFFVEVALIVRFTGLIFTNLFKPPFEHRELGRQLYHMGYKSVALIGITGFILGLVLTLQSRPVLVDFGAESMLPGMVTVSIFREIGPVITALLCAGKISSGIGAELGSMRVTEQIDAMEVSGTNPMSFVVATRVMATSIMVPLLAVFASTIAVVGSYVAVNMYSNMSWALYVSLSFDVVAFSDIVPSFLKSIVFGFFIGLIGCYKGYYAMSGTESVGRAANSAVVTASLVIFIIDLIAVQVIELVYP